MACRRRHEHGEDRLTDSNRVPFKCFPLPDVSDSRIGDFDFSSATKKESEYL